MSLNRIRLALLVLASCGGEARVEHVTVQAPPAVIDAGAPPEVGCLAPLAGGKPIDAQKLDEAKQTPSEPERSFRVARVYFEAEHWVEAANVYRSIAFEHSESSVGIYSSQLYLECINQLAAHAHRKSCYDDMARDVPALHDLYCKARQNEEMCATLARVQLDIELLRAQQRLEEGVAKGNPKIVHESGEQFLAMVRAHCVPVTSDVTRCDELAFNAAAAFIASGDNASAERVRALMTDPKNGMHHSPLLQKLECKLDPTPRPSCR